MSRRKDGIDRKIKSLNISISLLEEVRELKKAGCQINLSKCAEDGIRKIVKSYTGNNLAYTLKKKREDAQEQIQEAKQKIEEVEEKAVSEFGMTLDDFINKNGSPKSIKEEKIEEWAEEYRTKTMYDYERLLNITDEQIEREVKDAWESRLSDYGYTGRSAIDFHKDTINHIINQEG